MTESAHTARDDLPAIAAYATMHGLGDEAAEAEWRFVAGEERERFRSVARASVAAYIGANRGDPADARAIILEAAGAGPGDAPRLREALAAVTADGNRLRDDLRDLASGWLADAADAEAKSRKPRGTYGQSPSELEAEAETTRGHATAVIQVIR